MGRRFGLMRGGGSCVSLAASRFLPSPSSLRFCTSITCIGLIGPDVWRSTWRGRHPVLPLIIVKKCLIAFQHVHPMGNRSHPPHRITGVSVWQARCIWQTTLPLMLKRPEGIKVFNHPQGGCLVFEHLTFQVYDAPEFNMTVYTPVDGTETRARLSQLLVNVEIR